MHIRNFYCALTVFVFATSAANAQNIESATTRMEAYLDQFEDVVGPGFSVVVVTADDILINRTAGVRHAQTGAPLTADTPIYIASQTKAYIGLVASVLDERGVLPLDTTLDVYWPDLEWPEYIDPAAFTLRDLLTHQVPFENGAITFLEAYVMRVDPADYPALIGDHSEPREAGFQYDNLGYNIYAAILETATGRSWQDWLDDIIFEPMGMDHTSARTSDFPEAEISWNHIWLGEESGWHDVPPKTDGMMQSAGGLVTSPHDMAIWLQLQLSGAAPHAGLTPTMLETAQTPYAQTGQEDGRNAYEMACSGYSLGWNICEYQGFEVHIHGGGYTGARTMMAFIPEAGVGIAAFSNSDNMTGWWTQTAVRMFLQFLADDENADGMAGHRERFYRDRTAMLLERRQQRMAQNDADEAWGGWSWQPDATSLSDFAGTYRSDSLPVDARLEMDGDSLTFRLGDLSRNLRPAQPDLFGATAHPLDATERLEFQRNEAGEIVSFTWNDEVFRR
jgi:CubicO group peptidase (beta-lactamase class C family)